MGATWKQLPDGLSDAARTLAEELRSIKDRNGLSLSEMATATHYSKASWERWLNGKRLITSDGLRALAACTGCDLDRLQGLLDHATREAAEPAGMSTGAEAQDVSPPAVVGPTAAAAADTAPPGRTEAPRRLRRPWLVGLGCAGALLLATGTVLRLTDGGGVNSQAGRAASAGKATLPPPPCQGIGCAGKDPQSTGCEDDDHTLTTTSVGTVIIYVHYSPRCQAAWGGLTDGAPGETATITNGEGDQQTALIHWGYDNYSMMVDAHDAGTRLQVCGKQPDGTGCTQVIVDPAQLTLPGN